MNDHPSRFIIAVVDDDQGVLESIEGLLLSADYEVRVFTSGSALLESGCLARIDCLISDINMPVMDGFELLRAARAGGHELPVILITAHPDMLKRFPPGGIDNCRLFEKPFDADELLAAVSDALRGPPPRTSSL